MKKYLKFIYIAIISIFIECVIFNINSYRIIDKKYEKQEINLNNIEIYGLEKIEENKYLITENNAYIEIKNINKPVGTIKFDANMNTSDSRYNINFMYKDETTKTYTTGGLPTVSINSNVEDTKYLTMQLTGNVQDLKILINGKENTIEINKIILNEPIPFEFNIIRFICIFMILYFIYIIFISKKIEKEADNKNLIDYIVLLVISIFSIIIIIFTLLNSFSTDIVLPEISGHVYEQGYTKSILSGKLYLDITPPEELINMENPYDYFTRQKEAPDSLYDIAFFEGKYYIYFSVIPVITLFVPVHILTGAYLNISYAIILYAILGTVFSTLLLRKIILKWFKKTNIKMLLLSFLILLFGNLLLFNVATPRMYEIVSLLGYYLVMQGLYLLFIGLENKEEIKYIHIVGGCISLALAVNARPNLIFVSFFIAPILIKKFIEFIKEKDKKKIAKYTMSVVIPYLLIGISIMIFNYVRFGSILEFGAKYQLTSNNMPALGYRLSTIPLGIWSMLFNPTKLVSEFPYIVVNSVEPRYLGFYGFAGAGIFGLSPILYILTLLPIFKNTIKKEKKELWNLMIWSLIIGIVMIIAIILVAASYIRYELDFAWMFLIPTIMLMLVIHEEIKDNEKIKKAYETIVALIILLGVTINLAVGFMSEAKINKRYKPEQFDLLRSKISFWE